MIELFNMSSRKSHRYPESAFTLLLLVNFHSLLELGLPQSNGAKQIRNGHSGVKHFTAYIWARTVTSD